MTKRIIQPSIFLVSLISINDASCQKINEKPNFVIVFVDLLATLAALVDYPLEDNEVPDSYNILSALIGASAEPILLKR